MAGHDVNSSVLVGPRLLYCSFTAPPSPLLADARADSAPLLLAGHARSSATRQPTCSNAPCRSLLVYPLVRCTPSSTMTASVWGTWGGCGGCSWGPLGGVLAMAGWNRRCGSVEAPSGHR